MQLPHLNPSPLVFLLKSLLSLVASEHRLLLGGSLCRSILLIRKSIDETCPFFLSSDLSP